MIARRHALARRLRRLRKDPAVRAAEGVFVAEGVHLAAEAVRSGAAIELAVTAPALATTEEGRALAARLRAAGVRCEESADEVLASLQDARSPQPILLVVRRPDAPALDRIARSGAAPPLIVVCCGLQDPGNLGSVLRSAEAAGASGAIVAGGADLYHPRTVRATMGAIFRLAVASGPAEAAIEALSGAGVATFAAVPRGRVAYDAADWCGPCAVVLGGEGGGLPPGIVAACDETVGIPLASGVESLSVGAAAAVLLFEAARTRRLTSGG